MLFQGVFYAFLTMASTDRQAEGGGGEAGAVICLRVMALRNQKKDAPKDILPFVQCGKDYCSVPFSAALIMFSLAEM